MRDLAPLLFLIGCPMIGAELDADRKDVDGDGTSWPSDCDEGDAAVFPGAEEVCNGVDDDCDGAVDEAGSTGELTFWLDRDGDGYGDDGAPIVACQVPDGAVDDATDCDDDADLVNPGRSEVCDNGVDDDCSGDPHECRISGSFAGGEADLMGTGAAAWSSFGYALTAGDVGGDGVADLIVGEPGVDAAYVFRGPIEALDAGDADLAIRWGSGVGFGTAVLAPGDVTGDGAPDVVVAASQVPVVVGTTTYWLGHVWLIEGPVTGSGDIAPTGEPGVWGESGDAYGGQLEAAHTTGGSSGDLLISAAGASGYSGSVFLFRGPVAGPDPSAASARVTGTASYQYAGYATAAVDLDGDGLTELAVGSPGLNDYAGEVEVSDHDVSGVVTTSDAPIRVTGTYGNELAGIELSAGDLDGDGLGDLVIGTADAVAVFTSLHGAVALSEADTRFTGGSVPAVGDFDADGQDDLVVGRYALSCGAGSYCGGASIAYGPLEPGSFAIDDVAGVSLAGERPSGQLGYRVALAPVAGSPAGDLLASGFDADGFGMVVLLMGRGL